MPKLQQIWDNSRFYTGSEDPRIVTTVEQIKVAIDQLAKVCLPFNDAIITAETLPKAQFADLLSAVRIAHQQRTEISQQFGNLQVFISSILSVNARDVSAREWKPTLQQLSAEMSQATKALDVFLTRVNADFIELMIADNQYLSMIEDTTEKATSYFLDKEKNLQKLNEFSDDLQQRSIAPSFELLKQTEDNLKNVIQGIQEIEFS
jgi:oligoendopeptidase F